MVSTARKKHYTHALGELLGVHIGVYQP